MHDERLESLLHEADPAAGLIAGQPSAVAASVRRRLGIVQRRRRLARQCAGAVVMYAAGLATMWCWPQSESEQVGNHQPAPEIDQLPPSTESEPTLAARDEPTPTVDVETPLVVTESVPAATPYRTLRLLGDRYLLQQGKVDLAVDAYARALEHASDDERQISYEHDSWLLISLKRDRLVSSL